MMNEKENYKTGETIMHASAMRHDLASHTL